MAQVVSSDRAHGNYMDRCPSCKKQSVTTTYQAPHPAGGPSGNYITLRDCRHCGPVPTPERVR